jgi:hypothetical protein
MNILWRNHLDNAECMEIEHTTQRIAIMGRATRVTHGILLNKDGWNTAVEEIRAAYVELDKWGGVSSELSAAFEAFEPILAHTRSQRAVPQTLVS